MTYVENLLARSERVVRVVRDHWITVLPTILIDFAVSIVIIGLSVLGGMLSPPWPWFGLLLLVVPIVHLVLRLWAWWSKQVILTNRRIVHITLRERADVRTESIGTGNRRRVTIIPHRREAA